MLLERLFRDLRLTLEAFAICEVADGWRLRLRGLDWVTVHFVLAGSGRLRAGAGQVVSLPAGSLALVPANRSHLIEAGDPIEHETTARSPVVRDGHVTVYEAGGEDELIVVCGRIQAEFGDGLGLFDHLDEPLVLDFSDTPEMAATFERLLAEQEQRGAMSGPMMTSLMNEALIHLFRRLCAEPDCPLPWLAALEDPRLRPALEAIVEHPERTHTLASLAASVAMSRSTFTSAFVEAFDRPPMTYLRETRMRRAADLLRSTDAPVEQIAARVGYTSRSRFSQAFTGRFGVSPTAFRRGGAGT